MFCKKCGKQIDNDSEFCVFCGNKTKNIAQTQNNIDAKKVVLAPNQQKNVINKDIPKQNLKNNSISPETAKKLAELAPPEPVIDKESNHTGFKIFLLIAIILIVIVSVVFAVMNSTNNQDTNKPNTNNNNNSNNTQIFSRAANINDIYLTTNNDFSLEISCTLKPNVDIKNLQLKFVFLDSKGNSLTTKTKSLGNVNENTDYKVTFALTEFSVSELFKINQYKISVIAGTVSYF